MKLIERATKTKFETHVKHKHICPSVPKKRIMPLPHRYSEGEKEAQHDHGVEEEQPPAQTGLTGSPNRSDRFRPE
jgi:hypothetical protein